VPNLEIEKRNPVEIILCWFENVIPTHKPDIAFCVLTMIPGYDSSLDLLNDNLDKEFVVFLRGITKLPRLKIVEYAFALREAITYAIKSKSTKTGWAKFEEHLDFTKSHVEEDVAFVSLIQKRKMEIPFRSKQWSSTGKSWEKVLAESLNDLTLEQWLRN
jgi:hypothetical protein